MAHDYCFITLKKIRNNMLTARQLSFIGLCTTTGLLLAAYYFEYVQHLEPCPLCIIQRFMLGLLGLFFLLCWLQSKQIVAGRIYSVLISLVAASGAAVAGRHLWLQYHPPSAFSCSADLSMMLTNLPFSEVLARLLAGSGDCTKISWQWLGLSMPGWTLLAFLGLAFLGICLFLRTYTTPRRGF
jgi:protein dithiol:quinone oxidoreductase